MPELMDPLAAAFEASGTNGEAVVLIHGFTGTPAHFRPLATVLHERGYSVSVPRLAGHGTRMQDLERTSADDWIASAAAATSAVSDHQRVHLVGLSMGGLIGLLLAERTGAASVTTINSPVLVRDPTLYLTPIAHRFRPVVEWPDDGAPDLDEEMTAYWITYAGFPTRAAAQLVTIMRRGLMAARRLDRPSLVVQSRTDESVHPVSGRILRRALGRRSRLVWLRRSLHVATLDRERDAIEHAVVARLRG